MCVFVWFGFWRVGVGFFQVLFQHFHFSSCPNNVLLLYSYARKKENEGDLGEETTPRQIFGGPSSKIAFTQPLVKLQNCREESNGKEAVGVGLETVTIEDSPFSSHEGESCYLRLPSNTQLSTTFSVTVIPLSIIKSAK